MKSATSSSCRLTTAAAAICLATIGSAQAANTTAAMAVQAIVPVSCTGSVGTQMDFSTLATSLALGITQTDTTGTIGVTCTSGGAYTITAGDGGNYSTGWQMANGINRLKYTLYSDSGRLTTYARTGTTVGGTGNGALQSLTVYGRIITQTATAPGTYTDSVTFTITY